MATVRAKFKVNEIKIREGQRTKKDASGHPVTNAKGYVEYEPCELRTIVMNPVYGHGDPHNENDKFWEATPSGELRMECINPAANEQFKLGQEWYIDFTLAEKK